MVDSQRFYRLHHQKLLDAHQRMEEDEAFREIIQESNRHSQQVWSISIGHELDSIPVVIIRNFAILPQLISALESPFAQLSVAELDHGVRVDRFLAIGIRWLLMEDRNGSVPSFETRNLVNGLLTEVRRRAVGWLLQISSPDVSALYFHLWTVFLNCAVGRRACLHFRLPENRASQFARKLLHPNGYPTVWQLIKWRESKSNVTYVDLEFELLQKLLIRRTFCFPKHELHCLAAITLEGQNLLPHAAFGCKHVQQNQQNAFWKHEDPRNGTACPTTASTASLVPHTNGHARIQEWQPGSGMERLLEADKTTPLSSDTSRDQASRPQVSQPIVHRRAASCHAILIRV